MEKTYSVKMENDELVSIDVNGVTYTDPEDIPDREDRERVRAMVARSRGADSFDDEFGEEFDRQMAAEVAELNRQTAVIPKVIMWIFLGIGALMLVIAGISSFGALRTISREESARGRVVDMMVRASRDSQTGYVTEYSYPVIEFTPAGRQTLTVQLAEGSSPPSYGVGDEVIVLYDPAQPREARIKSFTSNLLMWILPGITFLVGAAFVGAAVVVFRLWPARKNEAIPA